jgi:glycerophosphoryl diester phosphodiesterase
MSFVAAYSKCLLLTVILAGAYTKPVLSQDKAVQLFAHRAGAHEQDENTLQAFEASFAHGLRGFETDIRVTKDGVLVVMHDASLERTTIGTGIVEEMTADEIRKFKTKKGNPILFLDELLKFLNARPGLYVEFEMKTNPKAYPQDKLERYCDQLYAAIHQNKPANSTYLMTSFDKRPLQYLKSKYPSVDLLFITSSPLTKEVIQQALELGVKRVGCNLGGTSRTMVKQAQSEGILVSLWPGHTVNDFLLGVYLGSDYLCSDIPAQVYTYLKEKMPWVSFK